MTALPRGPILCRLAACLGLLAAASQTAAQDYELSPGDRIRAQILGINSAPYVATVNPAGEIRLPFLGTHRAAGKTLDELIEEIAVANTGLPIRTFQGDVQTTVVLDERDIFLDIESYRPITVTGTVANPGQVPFEPGLTVRGALGIAGGLALSSQSNDPDQVARLRSGLNELQKTEAWLLAELWRIDVLLEDGEATDLPANAAPRLARHLSEEDLEVVRQRIGLARQQRERDREDIAARIALTEARIGFLSSAMAQYQTASDNEETRLQDVLSLAERGLVTANAIDSARAGALGASSRVLTTEADLAETQQQLQSLLGQQRDVDALFITRLLEEKARIERSLSETQARIQGRRDEISLASLIVEDDGTRTTIRVMLFRNENGEEMVRDASFSDFVAPGDVLEAMIVEP